MTKNPQTHTLGVGIAKNAVGQYYSHPASRLQEIIASLNEEHFGRLAVQLIPLGYLLINLHLGTKRRIGENHVKLTLGIALRGLEMEITVSTMLNALTNSLCNKRHIRLASVRIVKRVDIVDI